MESEVDILEGNPVISELCEKNDDNGSSTDEYAESTDDPTRPGKKRKVGSCPNVKCVDADDDYMLTCSCCKHKHHYRCSDLPPYQIVRFNLQGYRKFYCVNCVVVPDNIRNACQTEAEEDSLRIKNCDCEKNIEALNDEIHSKDEIIENLKFKIDNLEAEGCALRTEISNLTSDISPVLENTNKIQDGVSNTDEILNNSRPEPNSKNLTTLPVQLVDGDSTNTEINNDTPNTIEGNDVNGDIQRANSKLVDENNSLKEIAKQDKQNSHEQERRLQDLSIICNKTELAYNAQRELVEAKDQLINLQKDAINYQKSDIASLTSTRKDVVLMVDQSTEVMDAMLRPFSNENGLITNALLLWLDIQRKTIAENIWKTQALSHFTKEEITDAKT